LSGVESGSSRYAMGKKRADLTARETTEQLTAILHEESMDVSRDH
jgi:hypothetical protein